MAAERRVQQPTADSFAAFYREWRDFVRREAFFLCGSEADVEDVVQTVFLHLWECRRWSVIQHPRAYLRGAIRREAFGVLPSFDPLPDDFEIVDPSRGPFQQAVAGEARVVMVQALGVLPPQCAVVMRHTFLDGLSASEIAALLGVGTKAVRKQRARGRRLLKAWFEGRGGASVWVSTFGDGGGKPTIPF